LWYDACDQFFSRSGIIHLLCNILLGNAAAHGSPASRSQCLNVMHSPILQQSKSVVCDNRLFRATSPLESIISHIPLRQVFICLCCGVSFPSAGRAPAAPEIHFANPSAALRQCSSKVKGACVVCVGIALAQRSCTALLRFETRAPHHFRQVRDNGPPSCCTMGMKWSSRMEEQPFPPRYRRRRWRLNLPTFGAVCGNVKRHGSIATGQNRGARTARNNFDLHQHGNAKAQWFENAIPERDRGDRICVDAIQGISSRTGF
jgi:hypothetical protein